MLLRIGAARSPRRALLIGSLVAHSARGSASASASTFADFTLVEKRPTGSNGSQVLIFAAPDGSTLGGLDASTVPTSVYAAASGLKKSYSPVSRADQIGTFELLVRPYPPREGGGLALALCNLGVGTTASLQVKPARKMHGSPGVVGRWSSLSLVAAGTGVAPFVQILRHVLPDSPSTRVSLLFANRKAADILMREEIDALAAAYGPQRLRVRYVISEHDDEAAADSGAADGVCASELLVGRRIDLPMLREFLPPPRPASQAGAPSDCMVMVCGTDGFVEALAGPTTREPPDPVTGKKGKKVQGPLTGHLAELGYTAEEVYKF